MHKCLDSDYLTSSLKCVGLTRLAFMANMATWLDGHTLLLVPTGQSTTGLRRMSTAKWNSRMQFVDATYSSEMNTRMSVAAKM